MLERGGKDLPTQSKEPVGVEAGAALGLCPCPPGREHGRSPLPSLLWQVFKILPLRKVLKRRKRRILRLQAPACQSWWVLLAKEPPASRHLLLGTCLGPQRPTPLPAQREAARCPEPRPSAPLRCPRQHQCPLLLTFGLRLFQYMLEPEDDAASRIHVGLQQEEDMEVDIKLEEEEEMEVDMEEEEEEAMEVD